MIILNERQHVRQTKCRFRRYSTKYKIWAGEYFVGGDDRISGLLWQIRTHLYQQTLKKLYVPMTTEHLRERLNASPYGVVMLGRGVGLKGEPVIFTVIEDRGE